MRDQGLLLKWMRQLGYDNSVNSTDCIIAPNTEEVPKKELSESAFVYPERISDTKPNLFWVEVIHCTLVMVSVGDGLEVLLVQDTKAKRKLAAKMCFIINDDFEVE